MPSGVYPRTQKQIDDFVKLVKSKHFPTGTKWKMDESKRKNMSRGKGKDNPRWKGGYEWKLWCNRERRAKKKMALGSHTFGEWELLKKQYGYTCPCCGRSEPEITLTVDHIIPLDKGGADFIENIQPLCGSCNSRKFTKTIKYEL